MDKPRTPNNTPELQPDKSPGLRMGLFLRGVHAVQLQDLALKHDTQPGRVANRLLCEALDLAARGGEGR